MFVLAKPIPGGVVTQYHAVIRVELTADGATAVVNSYAAPEMALLTWQSTPTLPASVPFSSLADVEAILVSPGNEFAGGTIIDPAAADLSAGRARLWGAVKAGRDACAAGGCETPLGRVDSDERSRILIAGAVQMARIALAAGEPYSVDWVMADNQPKAHDAAAMIALGMAVGQHIADCWERAQTLRAAIDAADTVEALASIDIINGWPGAAA